MNESSPALPGHAWWQTHRHPILDVMLGPCAWHANMLRDQAEAPLQARLGYLRAHPTLLVVPSDADDALCGQVRKLDAALPLAVCMAEPSFVRQFESRIEARLSSLGAEKVSIVILEVEDLAELKSGGLLQVLFDLRQRGWFDHVGLAVNDALGAEWLATRAAARVLMLPYDFEDQTAAWRALPLLEEEEKFCLARQPWSKTDDLAAVGFALSQASRVLGVFDQPLPAAAVVMPPDEAQRCQRAYMQSHEPPAKLPRSHPPE